ncbi:MAG: hypothetical protein WC632_01475 [Candidatus Margulisiibacteriota bacterium]
MINKIFFALFVVVISSGIVLAAALKIPAGHVLKLGGSTLAVPGDWSNSGTFTAGTGTIKLNVPAGSVQTIFGDNTFYNLESAAAGGQINFEAGKTQTVGNNLTFNGAAGNLITLRSTTAGTQWQIDPRVGRNVTYVDAKDLNNINATVLQILNSTDSGNNTNVQFDTATTTTTTTSTTTTTVPVEQPSVSVVPGPEGATLNANFNSPVAGIAILVVHRADGVEVVEKQIDVTEGMNALSELLKDRTTTNNKPLAGGNYTVTIVYPAVGKKVTFNVAIPKL